jgi:ribosomal protein L22
MEEEKKTPTEEKITNTDNAQKGSGEKPNQGSEEQKKSGITDTKDKKSKVENKPKKTEAVVNAKNLPISIKHSIAICNMIRGKDIDQAISLLEMAEQKRISVPMKGEIPHRKGKGIMSGRYPIKALGYFIKILKSLKANAFVNELELEKYEIFCKANIAARPYRRFGRGRFKRIHLTVKLIPLKKKKIRK